MTQTAIFGPLLSMFVLTFVVWVYMYVRRIHFIQSNDISPKDLQVPGALAALTPAEVSNPSDNFQNLFEMPVLFYAAALYLYATGQVDTVYVVAGWVFVAFRVLHSAVHCTVNLVMVRFNLYLVSSLAAWAIVARAVVSHFMA